MPRRGPAAFWREQDWYTHGGPMLKCQGRRRKGEQDPSKRSWWALWVCRNPWVHGLLLPFAYLVGNSMLLFAGGAGKHTSKNLGGRYEQQPWWALWVCRNPWVHGLLLPVAYLAGGPMLWSGGGTSKHPSNNLGGRYGVCRNPWAQGLLLPFANLAGNPSSNNPGPMRCSCLSPHLPRTKRCSLMGAQANRQQYNAQKAQIKT